MRRKGKWGYTVKEMKREGDKNRKCWLVFWKNKRHTKKKK